MNSPIPLTLEQFNQQVLVCQDDAFTLAMFLVGDEQLACQILQEVIMKVYTDGESGPQPIELQVLRGVIVSCRQVNQTQNCKAVSIPGWEQLKHHEKEVLLLVDVLEKPYQNAMFILNNPRKEIVQKVAMARRILARSIQDETVPCAKEILS